MPEIGEVISGLRSHLVRFGRYVHIFGEKDSELNFLGVIEHEMFAKHSFAKILDCLHASIHIETRAIFIGDSKAGKTQSRIHVANRSQGFPIDGLDVGKGFRIRQNCYKAERNRRELYEFNQYLEHIVFAPTSSLILLKPKAIGGEKRVPDAYYSLKQGHVIVEDSWGSNDTFLLRKSATDGTLILESLKEVDRINKTINLYAKSGHLMMCTNSPNNERLQLLLVGSDGYKLAEQQTAPPDSTVAIAGKRPSILLYSFWSDGCYIQFGNKLFIMTAEHHRPIIEINLWQTFIAHQLSIQSLQDLICDRADVWRGCLRIGHSKQAIDLGIVQLCSSRIHLTVNGYVSSLRLGPLNHKNHTRTMFEDIDKSRVFKNRQKFRIGMAKLEREGHSETFPVDLNGTKHSIRLSAESRVFILTSMNATETLGGKIYRVRPNSYMLVSGHLVIVSSNEEGLQSIAVCKRGVGKNIQLLNGSHVVIAGRNGHLLFIGKNGINLFDWPRSHQPRQKVIGDSSVRKVSSKARRDESKTKETKSKVAKIVHEIGGNSCEPLVVLNERRNKSEVKQRPKRLVTKRGDRLKRKIKLVLRPNRKLANSRVSKTSMKSKPKTANKVTVKKVMKSKPKTTSKVTVKRVMKSKPKKTKSSLNRKISAVKSRKADKKGMLAKRKTLNVLYRKSSNGKQNSKMHRKFALRRTKPKSSRY